MSLTSLQNKSCIHNRKLFSKNCKVLKEMNSNEQIVKTTNQSDMLNTYEQGLPKSEIKNLFDEQMKQLIAKNYHYFQNKMKVCCSNKPNSYRFKIPFKTGTTTYKKQYLKRNNSCQNSDLMNLPIKKTKCPFNGQSTYQNSFIPPQPSKNQNISNKKEYKANDSPAFMETSYNQQFLNWGGKNGITSMKPASSPATSGLPFGGTSCYKADFNRKDAHPSQKITHQSSFPKFANISMPYKSNYKGEFTPKKCEKQNNCKPKNYYIDNGHGFKGNTQYRGQFNRMKASVDCGWKEKTVNQIQTLMMSL